MRLELPPVFVLYDTEYTCWEGSQERKWNGPNEHREIVEIGAVLVEHFVEVSSIDLYVKPRINPHLSDYFIDLTKITQETVDTKGVTFEHAWRAFNEWRTGYPAYAFGRDESVIKENCELVGIAYEYDGQFHNIRELFASHGVPVDDYYSSTITEYFGVAPQGSAHNGLSDARSILQGLCLLKEQVGSN